MSEPVLDEPERDPGHPGPNPEEGQVRIRPGLKGLSAKVAVWLALMGIVPLIVFSLAMWPLVRRSSDVSASTADSYSKLHKRAVKLAEDVNRLQEKLNQTLGDARDMARRAHDMEARNALRELLARLTPMVTGKKNEEVAGDEALQKSVRQAAGPFAEIALLDAGFTEVLLRKSGEKTGSLESILPDLKKEHDARKTSPPLGESAWHWTSVGRSGFSLAVQATAPEAAPAPSIEVDTTLPSALQADALASLGTDFSKRAWLIAIVLCLLGLAMAGFAFLWMKAGLLAPLKRITLGARNLLADPARINGQPFERAGMVEDLAASLTRLAQRMRRLEDADRISEQTRVDLELIVEVLDEASKGRLGQRVEVAPGPCESVARSLNRMLDESAERFEALLQAGGHLEESARRLQKTAGELSRNIVPAEQGQIPSDPGTLGDLLGVQLESLCQRAHELIEDALRTAPETRSREEREVQEDSIGSVWTGVRLLTQRASEIRASSDRLQALHQRAGVLATNLSIAAEARSWSQLEKIADETRELWVALENLQSSLLQELDDIVRAGSDLRESIRAASEHGLECSRRLETWESLREPIEKHGVELQKQIDLVRPAANSFGSDVRRMGEALSVWRKSTDDRQALVKGISESASALGQTAEAILRSVREVEIARAVPPRAVPGVVQKRRLLERAMRDLTELASGEGIEALSPGTSEILDRIRKAAEEAKLRIRSSSDKPDKGTPSGPEHPA